DDEDEPYNDDEEVDIEADDEEEEEHPAQAPYVEETEPFETDESSATPPPHPAYRITV
ncbi:hypothetical protein Tco_0696451, partial [Tanacetum coccineum]